MKAFLFAMTSVLLCHVSFPDTVYEESADGKTLVITVQTGETNVFDYANYGTRLTGNTYTEVIKRGAGVLDMKDSIEAYAGDFTVEAGMLRYWSKFALGSIGADCTVTVSNGATIAVHSDKDYPKFTLNGKTFIVEGFGVDGVGVIYNDGVSQSDAYPVATRIILTGDSLFSAYRRLDFAGRTVMDMGGHSLYIDTDSENSPISFLGGFSVENPGKIYVKNNGGLLMYGGVNWPYAEGCGLYLEDSSSLAMSECSRSASPWPIYRNTSKGILFSGGVSWVNTGLMTNRNFITGTLHTGDGLVKFSTQASSRPGLGVTLAGKVTGAGGIHLVGGDPEITQIALDPHLNLLNPENDFRGGAVVNHATLHLYAPHALPSTGGSLIVTNGTVEFGESGFYPMPDLVAHGTCRVKNTPANEKMGLTASATNSIGAVTFARLKSIKKTGAGDLLLSTAMTGDALSVEEGSVTINCGESFCATNYAAIAGLIEGCDTTHAPGEAQNDFQNMTAFTNHVRRSPVLAYYNGNYGAAAPSEKSNYITYSGYIWNRTGTNVNWSFALALSTVSRITIDTKNNYIGNGSSLQVGFKTFSLTPGPHRIIIAMRSNSEARSTARYFTNENATWPERFFGVGIDRLGRGSTNQADYEKLIDPGDGSVLTWTIPENLPCVYPGTEDVVDSLVPVRFTSMCFKPGTALNFVDVPEYTLSELSGTPIVSGCSNLVVKGDWNLQAVDMSSGGKLKTDGKLIFAENSRIVINGSSSEFRRLDAGVALKVAEAEEGVTGNPSVVTVCTDDIDIDRWTLSVTEDGVFATRAPYPLKIIVR